ncbi:MAG TPA: organomercurial lyase [Candidatus Limnocylindrales bacterium]|nr:organomercurial lyase [Candidatus Limnocylindrales bacterium]
MTPDDLAVRQATYRLFVQLGQAPTPAEVAALTGIASEAVPAAWRRLHDAHALVLDGAGGIRMLNPFSVVETPFVVEADGRRWFANCGWDAFGIGAALHVDSTIHTTCADCDEPVDLDVRDGRPTDPGSVFHILVPATQWWSDIGFT